VSNKGKEKVQPNLVSKSENECIFGQKPNKTVHCPFMLMVRKKARFWL